MDSDIIYLKSCRKYSNESDKFLKYNKNKGIKLVLIELKFFRDVSGNSQIKRTSLNQE